jgi:succinate dehydrogenase flavin-adding protein (antitoxin of CptAB toxin-antitoxin module)
MIKKLLYQSKNRGCKETDLLLGKFAEHYLHKMNDDELRIFAMILDQTDLDIVSWVMGTSAVPEFLRSSVMQKLLDFDLHRPLVEAR